MKSTIFMLTILVYLTVSAPVQIQNSDSYLIVNGVIKGLRLQNQVDFTEIVSDLEDVNLFIDTLIQAISNIETQTEEGVKEGIRLIGESIQQIPDSITTFEGGSLELFAVQKILDNLLLQFREPLRFTYTNERQLVVNGVALLDQITTGVQSWNEGDFENFGVQIGYSLLELLSQMENTQAVIFDQEVVEIIFDGVLAGIVDASGIKAKDIRTCIDGSQNMVFDFEESVRLLKTGLPDNVIQSLQIFGDGLNHFPEALDACKATIKEAAKLAKDLRNLIKALSSPQSFIFHIGIDLIVNGKDIYKEIYTAVDDWKQGNWYDFGFQLGKAMYQIFVGLQEQQYAKQ